MKAGRNDPCPCGSGKKYKKCCIAKDKDPEPSLMRTAVVSSPPSSVAPPSEEHHPKPARPALPARAAKAPTPPPPRDPVSERGDILWREFESQRGEGRIAVFLKTLEDDEVMVDDLAFEMLNTLHEDAVKSGERPRFAEFAGALRERHPNVFNESAHYYLSWCLRDALAEGRQDVVPSLARELAATAGRDIDTFNRTSDVLAYHGQLSVLVEALRIAWPFVKSSGNILPRGISEFVNKGADYEIFDYVEHSASPDPADAVMLERVQFFVEKPRKKYLRELIGDLTGKSARNWQVDDFGLKPPQKSSRDEWGDEREERQTPDKGAINLSRLINEFVGYLRREEGVAFPRGELVMHELYRYFVRRNKGDLNPRPSMLEQAMHPDRKLPKPPRPAHPLCPERVTLDVHLAELMGMLNNLYHTAAALFLVMPAWLRFLESRRLIDAGTNKKVVADLLPLHASLMRLWKTFTEDPLLYRQGQAWLDLP